MISQETVWEEIWPVVEALIQATLAGDDDRITASLEPGGEAARLYDLFGVTVLDILLKTVLGRSQLAITRAIQTEEGRYVHVEYVWPDPAAADGAYNAADLVTVQLQRAGTQWQVVALNPAAADLPLTEARARGVLLSGEVRSNSGELPREPWILPVALLAGSLPLRFQETALRDDVERLLLPGLQARNYGALSLLAGQRLWRDFREAATLALGNPAAWAAAAEFILSEQSLREVTQAAVGSHYQVGLPQILPRIRRIKKVLAIEGLDERYSALGAKQIVLKEDGDSATP